MATRTRRAARASAAPKQAEPTPDATEEQDADADAGGGAAISLSASDFENNPAVIDMTATAEGRSESAESDPGEDDDEEDDDEEEAPRARSSKATGGRVRVRLVGLKGSRRVPHGLSVIVPSEAVLKAAVGVQKAEGRKADANDYEGIHREGETLNFVRGRATSVSARGWEWLKNHPVLVVEKA